MKSILTYCLIVLFLSQAFEVGLIWVQFKLNQDYIAEFLCVNKDKPEMECHGCCQLRKEIAEKEAAHEKQEKSEMPGKPLMFLESRISLLWDVYVKEIHSNSSYHTSFYAKTPVFAIFHPPKSYTFTC